VEESTIEKKVHTKNTTLFLLSFCCFPCSSPCRSPCKQGEKGEKGEKKELKRKTNLCYNQCILHSLD
jgi:hypothetical protein